MKAEALVIGGGPAGSAVAIQLARAGRDVLLIERERRPRHKVCGEFLSAEALAYLRDLEIDLGQLGATAIHAARFTQRRAVASIPLPFPAKSVTRCRLDEAMLQAAIAAGVRVQRGANAERLELADREKRTSLNNGECITAKEVFLATGKHDLRGHIRPLKKHNEMVAFKMYWRLAPRQTEELAGHVELMPYRAGYAGLQPVENETANLCCLVEATELKRLSGTWSGLLELMCETSPHLRRRLENAQPLLEKPLAIATLPYGFVRETTDRLWHLGDQAAVIPSFTGDGMSLALHSASLAASMYCAGHSAAGFQREFASQVAAQVRFAMTISRATLRFPRLAGAAAMLWPGMLRALANRTRIAPGHLQTQTPPLCAGNPSSASAQR